MMFKMAMTGLEGFDVQHYFPQLVSKLNEVVSSRMFNNIDLKTIGEAVSNSVNHHMGDKTKDDYSWFGTLNFPVKDGRVAVLFPWAKDWKNPESQQDRSINVYSNCTVFKEELSDLLENIAYQFALALPSDKINPVKELQQIARSQFDVHPLDTWAPPIFPYERSRYMPGVGESQAQHL